MKKNLKSALVISIFIHVLISNLWSATEESVFLQYTKKVSNCPSTRIESSTMDDDTLYNLINDLVYIIHPSSGKCSGPIKLSGFSTSQNSGMIAVDKTRKLIYATERFGGTINNIYQYGFDGKLIKSWSAPYQIFDMDIDSSGNIYITDVDNNYIQKFSSAGTFLLKWGGEGAYDGRFKEPVSLAIDKNNDVYVADRGNNRIQKFDSSGNFITKWGHYSHDSDDIYGFKSISQVAVDSNLKVYVADDRTSSQGWFSSVTLYAHDKMKMFYSNGDYIGSNKLRYIRIDARTNSLHDLNVDSSGNVYAGTHDRAGISSVHKYNKNYHFLDSWGNQNLGKGEYARIESIVFDKNHNMYVLDRLGFSITKVSKNGTFIRRWGQSGIKPGEFDKEGSYLGGQMSMAINGKDEIYIYDPTHNRVQRFDNNGKLLQVINIEEAYNGSYADIAIDGRDNIYLSTYTSSDSTFRILVYDKYGKKKSEWVTGKRIKNMTLDKKRNLLYASTGEEIIKYDLSGNILTGWSLKYIQDITVSEDGSLYISYMRNNDVRLCQFSNSGIFTKEINGVIQYTDPRIIAIDTFGNLFYNHYQSFLLRKSINPDIDHDGVPNERDAFPFNRNEWLDTDHDGIGNNADKDDDNDGIPDSVEKANKLNPLKASDASGDLDRDGFSNVIEYNTGTNMRSARSHPTWTPVIMGDIMIFIPAK